ncbi:hypothetical protein [Pedobacter sp. CFBP9032]|uniref:hypothetical protein n=1 Tax=Pedobacter sp. CFBP9032 TaxID=3096539 RepID=UPI002A6AF614|nr:hypothetical protein [Pedobacter sp. CFBP9032]MDY0906584.1 hypothetical protein [Pedobacter sp. CFBP9032]
MNLNLEKIIEALGSITSWPQTIVVLVLFFFIWLYLMRKEPKEKEVSKLFPNGMVLKTKTTFRSLF